MADYSNIVYTIGRSHSAEYVRLAVVPSVGGFSYDLPWYFVSISSNANNWEAVTKEQQKPFFVVPFSRDPLFLGRENVIDLVDAKFKSEHRVALIGIGGVGWVTDLS